ncbi:MAG: methyl-accepting chemotaxis protein [Chitinophagales bacterium]
MKRLIQFIVGLKLRTQMLLFVVAVIAIMGLQGIYNLATTSQIVKTSEQIYDIDLLGVRYAMEVEASFNAVVYTVYQHIASPDPRLLASFEQSYATSRQAIDQAFKDYEPTIVNAEDRANTEALRKALDTYLATLDQILAVSRQGKKAEAFNQAMNLRDFRNREIAPRIRWMVDFNTKTAREEHEAGARLATLTRRNTVLGIFIVGLFYLALALIAPTMISRPMQSIQTVMDGVAHGDLSRTVPLSGTNEMGQLAKSINETIQGLRGLISQVGQASTQVGASSQELASSAQTVGQVTQQVTDTIGQMATGADEQARAAQQTGQKVAEIAAAIERLASAAQQMADNAEATAKLAMSGLGSVDQAVKQMETIKTASGEAAAAVDNLNRRSGEIGRILEVITGIADQTNLLALNAAIEAARAGEHGRGFAVVAEEVRKLAEQSRQAAGQISVLVGEIQTETARAVTTMDAGAEEVETGVSVVNASGQAFRSIAEAARQASQAMKEVNTTAQQVAAASEQAVQAVESIAAITQESAAGAQEVSAAAEEQAASIEEIAASSESLARLAQELQTSVSVFRM